MEENILITILTPTYNRAHLLGKLYESLLNQDNYNFEWLIIDDGSSDNTKDVVETFKNEKFVVNYVFKENGGKHRALNMGINRINTPLTFIVDSDDWLTNDSVRTICNFYSQYKENNKICGFSFLRMYSDGEINVSTGRTEPFIDSYFNVRVKEKRVGDMAEVYYTEVLKSNLFPEIENEKFIGEDIVWLEISKKYDLVFIEKAIYVSDYLQEGLTSNRRSLNIKNSKGCYYRSLKFLEFANLPIRLIIKCILQMTVYGMFSHLPIRSIFIKSNYKLLTIILLPFSLIIYWFYKIKWVKYEN